MLVESDLSRHWQCWPISRDLSPYHNLWKWLWMKTKSRETKKHWMKLLCCVASSDSSAATPILVFSLLSANWNLIALKYYRVFGRVRSNHNSKQMSKLPCCETNLNKTSSVRGSMKPGRSVSFQDVAVAYFLSWFPKLPFWTLFMYLHEMDHAQINPPDFEVFWIFQTP